MVSGIKAWDGVISHPLPGRLIKPRDTGLTMVIDKGLGIGETQDLLELAADYIDYIKLTFGTSAFYSRELLEKKIALIRSYGVEIYPGGTFFEVALVQDSLGSYLKRASELGFSCIEISDGTITLDPATRKWAILEARMAGFRVITEVGKKDTTVEVPEEVMIELAQADLEAGAFKVIVEGRESGKGVGIYDKSGAIDEAKLGRIADASNNDNIIWEAPLKAQQEELIIRFGTNVNLGNIPTTDILALEALRVGLRGDTLRYAIQLEEQRSILKASRKSS